MASLAISLAGGLVSHSLGFGFSIGYSIASAAYSFFEPKPQPPTIEGPRLRDLTVTSSAYGSPIPRIYRKGRVGGNIIWSSGIKEQRIVKKVSGGGGKGGGGGGSSVSITYEYTVDLAIAVCEGSIAGIEKIWAGPELIYDVSERPDDSPTGESETISFGFGAEDELPNAMLETALGVDNVPAYRGLGVVYFENFPLKKFGNRVPNFSFVPVRSGAFNPVASWTYLRDVPKNGIDPNEPITGEDAFFSKGKYRGKYWCWTLTKVWVSDDGNYWTLLPGITGISHIGTSDGRGAYAYDESTGLYFYGPNNYTMLFSEDGVFWKAFPSSNALSTVVTGNASNANHHVMGAHNGWIWKSGGRQTSPNYVGDRAFYYHPILRSWSEYTQEPWNSRSGDKHAYAVYENRLYMVAGIGSETPPNQYNRQELWEFIPLPNGYFEWLGYTMTFDVANYGSSIKGEIVKYKDYYYAQFQPNGSGETSSNNKTFVSRDLLTWNFVANPPCGSHKAMMWATRRRLYLLCSGFGTPKLYYLTAGLLVVDNLYLSNVVTDICARCGLSASDIDVSDLASTLVEGYIIDRSITAREELRILQKAYFFDIVESEYVIKFILRGNASVLSISDDELSAHQYLEELPSKIAAARTSELELYREVSVVYPSEGLNYQNGLQRAVRLITASNNVINEFLPVLMSDDKARQVAEILLFNAWNERTQYEFLLGKKYSYLEPTDVITITANGITRNIRITEVNYSRQGVLDIRGTDDDSNVYASYGVGGIHSAPVQTVEEPGLARVRLLDIPLLRDEDAESGLYAVPDVYSGAETWKGASLYLSRDNGYTYEYVNSFSYVPTYGYVSAVTTLSAKTNTILNVDTEYFDVVMQNGELYSTTEEGVFNLVNVCLVGDEIISFRDAEQQSDLGHLKKYRLKGLLRGLNGTDGNSIAKGDYFLMLNVNDMIRVQLNESDLNQTILYKLVNPGEFIESVPAQAFTNTGISQKPYSPVHFIGERNASNDLTINWQWRTRIGGAWRDFVDASFSETSEEYDVEIYRGGTVLVRSVTVYTNQFVYTAAMQAADSTTSANVLLNIYQKSSSVGRGYKGEGWVR